MLYQDRFRTPEYFWFSPDLEFEGFRLRENEYEAIAPNQRGWRWSKMLSLYLGVEAGQLRYFTAEGQKVPTPEEAVQQEQRRAEQAELQIQQERQEKQRLQVKAQLVEQLRRCEAACRETSLGVDPETLA